MKTRYVKYADGRMEEIMSAYLTYVFKELRMKLGDSLYKSLFPVILTDNGSSFDELTQEDVNKMMDHINLYKRKKLNNRSPYEAFGFYYGETVLAKLGCTHVSPGEIILKPSLLK